jgi:hypothetical protein
MGSGVMGDTLKDWCEWVHSEELPTWRPPAILEGTPLIPLEGRESMTITWDGWGYERQ